MPFYTNQLGLGKGHWNLETSSAVVEFPSPYHRDERAINKSEHSETLKNAFNTTKSREVCHVNGKFRKIHGMISQGQNIWRQNKHNYKVRNTDNSSPMTKTSTDLESNPTKLLAVHVNWPWSSSVTYFTDIEDKLGKKILSLAVGWMGTPSCIQEMAGVGWPPTTLHDKPRSWPCTTVDAPSIDPMLGLSETL